MAATATDGDCGPWIYSHLGLGYTPFSIGSSSSGTIVSTAYTSSGSSSGLSSVPIHMETAMPFAKLTMKKKKKKKHIKSLVQEFFGAPSANGGGDMSVLERWFSEMGVGWVLQLQLDDGVASAVAHHDYDYYARSWVSGLFEITNTIHLRVAFFSEIKIGDDAGILDAFQFAQFIQKAMLKMLAFVDVIVAWNNAEMSIVRVTNGLPPSYDMLGSLVSVHGALSKALSEIPLLFPGKIVWIALPIVKREQVRRIRGEVLNLLSANEGKAADAVSTAMQQINSEVTRYLYVVDDSSSSQGSPDIHKATRSVMRHITFLQSNYSSMAPFVSQAVAASHGLGDKSSVQPLDSMTMEITSCLEEKLAQVSESFPDQGLKSLFLLNNLYFIKESLLFFSLLRKAGNERGSGRTQEYSSLEIHVAALFEKVDGHMQNYLHESWEPILSCLFNPSPTPLWLFRRSYSVLSKFVSAFEKTYATQKLWKVPDPKLRKNLRAAIIDKIIPGYTKYIEENNIATPKLTPKEMEEMLQELFEG